MARSKQASKQKGRRKTLPFVGAAGVSLAFAGGAYATAPTEPTPPQDTTPRPIITLGEEEISDVKPGDVLPFRQGKRRVRRPRANCPPRLQRLRVQGLRLRSARLSRLRRLRLRGGAILWLRLWRLWLQLLHRLPGVGWLGLGLDLLAEHARPAAGCRLLPRSPAPSPQASGPTILPSPRARRRK